MGSGESAVVVPVFLGLGSNIDPERNLAAAVSALSGRSIEVVAVSSAWRSLAVGPPGQPWFLNAALELRTALSPSALKREILRPLEAALGRHRSDDRFAPRPIDLDLTLYGDLIGEAEGTAIPDPDLLRHLHVALPLAEIAPARRNPVTGETVAAIRDRLLREARGPIPERDARLDLGAALRSRSKR